MKNLSILYFTLFSFCVLAQKKEAPVIKIYLEDAETGKNIPDAKVTLEGFEIPAITGKYDKVGKYYYFTEIPVGYNTIMAYHKKYNEKGFQNMKGLPKELKLKLYTPYRVRIPNDSLNYYKEDPSKLTIIMNDTLYRSNKRDNYLFFVKRYFKEHYPTLVVHPVMGSIFPLFDFSFYVMKKNSNPFKRFNDPVIKKLEDDKNILFLFGMLLDTKINKPEHNLKKEFFKQDGTPNYIPKYIKYINCDTIHQPFQPFGTKKLIEFTFDNNGNKKKVEPKKTPKKQYSDVYLSYKDKYKRKLLKNEIYTLNKVELDSLYKIDIKKQKKGELYNFLDNQKGDTLIDYLGYGDFEFTIPDSYPYVLISNILKINGLGYPFESCKFTQIIYYEDYGRFNLEDNYKSNLNLIEQVQKSDSQKIYKLKANIGSPFGTMDLIEYYNNYVKIKIYQNTKKIDKL